MIYLFKILGCIAEGSRKRASTQYHYVVDLETHAHTPSPTLTQQDESQQRFEWEDDFINRDTYPSFMMDPSDNDVSIFETTNASIEIQAHQTTPLGDSTSGCNTQEVLFSNIPPATQTPLTNQGLSTNLQKRNKRIKLNETSFSPFNEDYFAYKREEQAKYISAWKEIKGQRDENYSISAAMKAFKELPGFTFEDYERATDLFVAKPELREVFLTFETDERIVWIKKKVQV
jgi:hypothetical protein